MSVTHDFSIFPSASGGGWPHEIPSLLTHPSFLPSSKWEMFISVIIPELQKYSLSNINIWSIWILLHCCCQIASVLGTNHSRKTKAASFTAVDNPQKWTNDEWKYRKRSKWDCKWERYCEGFKEKMAENKVTANKKYFSLKKIVFLSHEKLS